MREIKFRAWNEITNEMESWNDIGHKEFQGRLNSHSLISGEYAKFRVMQYTGLKDKNGKEIFEGDILDCTCELLTNFGRSRTGKMGTTVYEVFWREEAWGKRVLRSDTLVVGKDSDGVAITAKYSEVIGNIYEHPHLLEPPKANESSALPSEAEADNNDPS